MNNFRLAVSGAFIAVAVLMVIPFELLGQHRHGDPFTEPYPVFQRIEAAVERGIITSDEAILQKLYAGLSPGQLDERFRNQAEEPIKCMTHILFEFEQKKDHMNPAIAQKVEQLIEPQDTQGIETYLSPSGNFLIRFSRTGQHAVPDDDLNESGIPDYVEQTAFAADSSYRYQIETLGFRDFRKNNPYEISYQNFANLYGVTNTSGSTTHIVLNNNFDGFPPNMHPEGNRIGALYATIAHEMKHASQYEINRWRDNTGSFDWIEMDATLMEHIVFQDVRDYYNYIMTYDDQKNDWNRSDPNILSIFGTPGSATPGAYNHVTWMIYFYEVYGAEFWVNVWNEIDQHYQTRESNEPPITFLAAMNRVLIRLGTSVESEHLRNHLWHMSSGTQFADFEFGFSDRANYPQALMSDPVQLVSDDQTVITGPPVLPFASRYHDLVPSSIALGQPLFVLESDIKGLFLGVVGYFRDGSVRKLISQDPNSTMQSIQTTWSWPDLLDMNVAVINSTSGSTGTPSGYTLKISSMNPESDLITQNYPNPFNPVTRIDFALNDRKDVLLEVFDILGRKVATLVDDRLNEGFHSVTFDGSGLSSGVYIYRIITDQTVVSNKMVLIK